MATFYQWLTQTTTAVGHYFRPSLVRTGNIVNFADATTTSTSETAPWTVTLSFQASDIFGDALHPASTVATYTVPATDPQSNAIFDFSYISLELASNLSAVFWTEPVGTYAPLDQTAVHMQRYDDAGNSIGTPVTLQLLGTQTDVTNLYDIGYSSGADYGNSFMIAYSTFDPSSKAVQIKYEQFSDAGAPIKGGVLYSINDGSKHGIDFGSYFTASGPYTPAYMLVYRLPQGATGAIHVHTMKIDGTAGPFDFDLQVKGPNGENSTAVDNYNFDRPNPTDPNGDFGVLTETFRYKDASNVVHEAIGLQTLGPTGIVLKKTTFEVGVGETATVRLAHVGHGAFVVGYSDGGTDYIKEFDSQLNQIGTTLALPNSSGDLTSLISLGDGRFQAMWREHLPDTSHSVLHSAIYDTRTAAVIIDDSSATTVQQIAGTVFSDTLTGGQAADKIVGNAGNDTINGGAGADLMIGGSGNDTYYVDNVADRVVEISGGGTDLVYSSVSFSIAGQNIEKETLTGSANINATGNGLDNTLTGNSGNNVLDGKVGADTMYGGAGDDTYYVDNAGDVARESANNGYDKVISSVSYNTNGQSIEELDLAGSANINGTGNALANLLVGNAGNNLIDGGLGNDTLTGGGGSDTFLFDTALGSNVDTITDFSAANDKIQLDRTIFSSLTQLGTLAAAGFRVGTSARDSNDYIVYNSATGDLFYERDGNGAAAAVQFAHLNGTPTLTSASFTVVA